MINTLDFYQYLVKKQLDFFVGVPDSLLKEFCACVKQNSPSDHNFITANEGNAIAMCAGHYLGTSKIGVVYMQNSGLGNAINPLLSLTDEDVYGIPVLLIIGWRGEPGVHDEPQHVKQGKVTLPLLDAMGIEHVLLNENYQEQVDLAIDYMTKTKKSVAIVVKKDQFSKYPSSFEVSPFGLTREESLKNIISCLSDEDFIVSTTGKTSREIFELREMLGKGHANDFLTVGSMGHTASIAFGLALSSKKDIFCIDGDGSFLMHMGSQAIIAQNAPRNFHYIMINNGAHESVGGQPTVALKIDIRKILCGCGFSKVIYAKTPAQIRKGMNELKRNPLYAMVIFSKQGSRDNLGRPKTTPQENKIALMGKIGSI